MNVVAAEVLLANGGRLALASPFHLTAIPDAPSRIQTLVPSMFSAPAQMILGAELPATVLDRFGNPIANKEVMWTQSPPTGAFIKPAVRLQDRVVLLDVADSRQEVLLEQVSDTAGRVVTNYINGGGSHVVRASVGAVSGEYSVQAYDSDVLEYVFGYVPAERASWDGIYGTHLPEPFVFQLLRRGPPAGPAWLPIRGDEAEYSSLVFGMSASSGSRPLGQGVTVTPLASTGMSPLDRDDNALFWPEYLAEDAVQDLLFTAELKLADGTRDCCGSTFDFSMHSAVPKVEFERILPGSVVKDLGTGTAYFDDEAVAVWVENQASYAIYARLLPQPFRSGDVLVDLPGPEVAPRHPSGPGPTLLAISPYSRTRVVLPIRAKTGGGVLEVEVVAPDVSPAGSPILTKVPGRSLVISGVRIKPLTNPPGEYHSFLAKRSYLDGVTPPTQDVIALEAEAPGAGVPITWNVSAGTGTTAHDTPSSREGVAFSFVPNPGRHPPYHQGNRDCADPGHGSCERSTPLTYVVEARTNGHADPVLVAQDEIDTILQEYWNHGLNTHPNMPKRTDFRVIGDAPPFVKAELNRTEYDSVLGNPGPLAQAMLERYNELLFDDEQVVAPGVRGLPPDATIVRAGADIVVLGSVLDTWPCLGSLLPSCNGATGPCCDDAVGEELVTRLVPDPNHPGQLIPRTAPVLIIVAGADGVAHTRTKRRDDVVLPPAAKTARVSSGWRNPERNEVFSKTPTSKHQFGDAVDMTPARVNGDVGDFIQIAPPVPVPGQAVAPGVQWCALEQAGHDLKARGVLGFAQTEDAAGDPADCRLAKGAWHVHVEGR